MAALTKALQRMIAEGDGRGTLEDELGTADFALRQPIPVPLVVNLAQWNLRTGPVVLRGVVAVRRGACTLWLS